MQWSLTFTTEAVALRCSVKKVFLESTQNSQESTYVRDSFLIKLQALGLKISKNTFFAEHLWWLLLHLEFGCGDFTNTAIIKDAFLEALLESFVS